MYSEDDYLQLSGIQHFAFCKRQWALIHIEMVWADNERTALGNIFHSRADEHGHTTRNGVKTIRSARVSSPSLGLSGVCDVVEFIDDSADASGIHPVEYKIGRRKKSICDHVQLCAQAIALEETLGVSIEMGYMFYGKEHRREPVMMDETLRSSTYELSEEMHKMFEMKDVPEPTLSPACKSCSLKNQCMPSVTRFDVVRYLIEMRDSR